MTDAPDPRPAMLSRAEKLLERAAEESSERSWRRNLLRSLAATTRRTGRKIERNPEDEVMPEPASTAKEQDPGSPWDGFRSGGKP